MSKALAILEADDREIHAVETPEWPVPRVWVRRWTLEERADFRRFWAAREDQTAPDFAYVCLLSACDEGGTRIFGPEHLEPLRSKAGAVLERIAIKALHVNDIVKQVEDAKKNLNEIPNSSSSTNSPLSSAEPSRNCEPHSAQRLT